MIKHITDTRYCKIFSLFLLFILIGSNIFANKISIVFRYDDFTFRKDSLDEGVVRVFQKHHIPLVLGVIPCDSKERMILDPNYSFLPILKKAVSNQSIEIAQHGLNHCKVSTGEFGNVAIEEQYRRIIKGKAILDSIFKTKIITFIPPYNAYDNNTLAVMGKIGFKGISSALCIGQDWSNPQISYFPETIEDFETLNAVLEHNKSRNGVVVVMFHHYTFKKNFTLSQLDSLLTTITKLGYLKCVTFEQLYKEKEISDKNRMMTNAESNLLSKYLHLNGVIQTTGFAVFIRTLNVLLSLCLSAFLFFLVGFLVFNKRVISTNKKYSVVTALLIIVGLSVWFHLLAPLKLLIVLAIISIGASLVSKIRLKE
jgi:peptidoglycan/xylan/chitin deacetylase (PgdA/CDA1 family)